MANTETDHNPWRFFLLALLAIVVIALVTAHFYKNTETTESQRITALKGPLPPLPPTPICDRVCVISIDGLRPDLLLRGNTPNIKALFARGAYSFWAQTTEISITLPSHVSMMTGVVPGKHGVTWNEAQDPVVYPKVPTLLEVAKQYRPELTSAVCAGKLKFNTFTRTGVCDWSYLPENNRPSDDEVARKTAEIIDAHAPNILFVHFANVDQVGHADSKVYPKDTFGENFGGWASPDQMAAIQRADDAVGIVLAALNKKGILKDTLVILSADHGGQGDDDARGHGPMDARSRHIPWIAAGPHVRSEPPQGYDLTRETALVINTEDTFATASYFLGLPMDPGIDGRPVLEIVDPVYLESLTGRKVVRRKPK